MPDGWIAVDLDGTLAEYDGWKGIENIGDPIPLMLTRVLNWIEQGKDVRIFTARVSHLHDAIQATQAIREWCVKWIGKPLDVTCVKDYEMYQLWDDRAVQVEKNTGRCLGPEPVEEVTP